MKKKSRDFKIMINKLYFCDLEKKKKKCCRSLFHI